MSDASDLNEVIDSVEAQITFKPSFHFKETITYLIFTTFPTFSQQPNNNKNELQLFSVNQNHHFSKNSLDIQMKDSKQKNKIKKTKHQ